MVRKQTTSSDFLWWRDGVIYQIYPRSYKDSNADGIGDLPGIIQKLDYLSDLGVDAIWLSPIYPSPDVDFGYDVSEYCAVDPKFGDMADFDQLARGAEQRGIRLVLDLVLNHTSDRHPWFVQSRASRTNPYHDWYLWHGGDQRGKAPNNWLAVIGGSAWQWEPARQQYYFHMFYRQQPDLNWRNPQVRKTLMDVVRFWLDRGVKGFRLDVFNLFYKDALLRNNPRKLLGLRPFNRQEHIYDCDQPEMEDALGELRRVLDGYEATYAIGETFLSSPAKASRYCGQRALHQAFNFKFLECPWRVERFRHAIAEWETALGANNWPNYVLNNHDQPRSATRYERGEEDERLKVAASMLLTLRGTPFLYYGEEIGMRDIRRRRSEILDPVGQHYWPFYKGRDGCRAPMQWDVNANSGFSDGNPWLPPHPDWPARNVEAQSRQPDSLLNCYRSLIALRRQTPALQHGGLTLLEDLPRGVLGHTRDLPGEQVLILLNFARSKQKLDFREFSENYQACFSTKGDLPSGDIRLRGDEGLILFRKRA